MAKEWILNSATNRFQLNFKRNVGAVSEEIRKCAPHSLHEWENYYFKSVKSRDHLVDLGRKLYVKITEVIASDVAAITEEDCISYVYDLVIKRTFDGYMTERATIYGQLQDIVGTKIEPAPDEWDRLFNVDFFIQVGTRYIGLQIKPASGVSHIAEIFKERKCRKKRIKNLSQNTAATSFMLSQSRTERKRGFKIPRLLKRLRMK